MMMRENVPVYVVTGFLESGKTSFLRYSMDQEGFMIERKTLLDRKSTRLNSSHSV